MQIWPHSASLDEAGAAPAAPAAQPGAPGPGGGIGMPPGMAMGAGEIMLNRAESAALAALETEEDDAEGLKRAAAESGLKPDQVQKLKARAEVALKKGITLKGVGFTKKPTPVAPDEPGLTRDKVKKAAAEKKPEAKKATKETNASAVLTRRVTGPDLYTCPALDDYGYPVPASESEPEATDSQETNAVSTMTRMISRARHRRRQLQR